MKKLFIVFLLHFITGSLGAQTLDVKWGKEQKLEFYNSGDIGTYLGKIGKKHFYTKDDGYYYYYINIIEPNNTFSQLKVKPERPKRCKLTLKGTHIIGNHLIHITQGYYEKENVIRILYTKSDVNGKIIGQSLNKLIAFPQKLTWKGRFRFYTSTGNIPEENQGLLFFYDNPKEEFDEEIKLIWFSNNLKKQYEQVLTSESMGMNPKTKSFINVIEVAGNGIVVLSTSDQKTNSDEYFKKWYSYNLKTGEMIELNYTGANDELISDYETKLSDDGTELIVAGLLSDEKRERYVNQVFITKIDLKTGENIKNNIGTIDENLLASISNERRAEKGKALKSFNYSVSVSSELENGDVVLALLSNYITYFTTTHTTQNGLRYTKTEYYRNSNSDLIFRFDKTGKLTGQHAIYKRQGPLDIRKNDEVLGSMAIVSNDKTYMLYNAKEGYLTGNYKREKDVPRLNNTNQAVTIMTTIDKGGNKKSVAVEFGKENKSRTTISPWLSFVDRENGDVIFISTDGKKKFKIGRVSLANF